MSNEDYLSHVRTYNRVLGMAKWFVLHMAIILPALYFFVIAGNPGMGAALIVLSIGILIYGFLRRTSIRRDLAEGLTGEVESDPAAR